MRFRMLPQQKRFLALQVGIALLAGAITWMLTRSIWPTIWFAYVSGSAVDGLAMVFEHRTKKGKRILFESVHLVSGVGLPLFFFGIIHIWWVTIILAFPLGTEISMKLNAWLLHDLYDEYGLNPPREQIFPLWMFLIFYGILIGIIYAIYRMLH